MSTLSPNISPETLLRRFRGPVRDAYLTYPDRIGLEVEDAAGGRWCLETWDAEYSPSNPRSLVGKSVERTLLEEGGKVVVSFSDGTRFMATPFPDHGDVENWDLFTPEGLVLVYGPAGRWQMISATEPH